VWLDWVGEYGEAAVGAWKCEGKICGGRCHSAILSFWSEKIYTRIRVFRGEFIP
jgi:hypothetical protein